jgi:hypothetical protein
MLNVEAIRRLYRRPDMPDAEAERIRKLFLDLADLLIEDYRARKEGRPVSLP